MDSSGSVALGRRTVDSFLKRAWRLATALCLALLALTWSDAARAQTCDFVAIGEVSQIGLPGTNLTFTIEAQTACAPTVDVVLAINPGETTGGAVIQAPTNPTLALDTPYDFTLTLGPNPGGSGTITATCVSGGCAGDTLVFTFATNNEFIYDAASPTNVVTNQISSFSLATSLQFNGAPGGLSSSFQNVTVPSTPTIVAPAGGIATFTDSIPTAGTYNFLASLQCPIAFVLEGCAAVPPVPFTVDVEPVSLTAVTPLAVTTNAGNPQVLTVAYGSPSLPAPDGTNIFWSISGQPPGGDGNLTTSGTIAGGQSDATFTATVPGVYTVFANSGCTFCAVSQQTFSITVNTVPGLSIASGDGQTALPGNAYALPLVVVADDSGAPAAGVGIDWVLTGDATLVPGGATDANGQSVATLTAGLTPGPITVSAARLDAPAVTVTFNLAVGPLGTLDIVSGDAQTLLANVASEPLVVVLRDANGAPIAGATVNWATSAGSLASATSVTTAAGEASNTVTLSAAGPVDVTASSPLAAAPATFAINGALASISGLRPGQLEVARAIDEACPALAQLATPTPQQLDLLARCRELVDAAGVDPAAVLPALDQLMFDVALAQGSAGMAAAQAQFQNLKTRIAALRAGGGGGTSFGGLAVNTAQGPVSLGLLAGAVSEGSNPAEVGADFSRWGFFAAGTIGRAEAEAGSVDPAYDLDVEGITAGVDYRWSDNWVFGGSLGMTRQDTTLPGDRGGLETRGWSVSAYTTWYKPDSWYVDGVLTWGRNDYEMLRRIQYTLPLPGGGTTSIDQQATSDSKGDLLSVAATFGRDFNRGAWGFGPYGRLLFTRLDFDEITETLGAGPGSGLGLQVRARELESLASVLGGKLTYTHSASWGVLMPHLQLEWEHEFRDDPQALEARFLHDPTATPMVLSGDPLDTDYFRLGLGMSMVLTKGRSGFFYYERLMGRDRTSQYNLALGLRMEF